MRCLLGIDVGTTGTKTLLFRQDGKLLGQSYCGYETKTPGVGRSEQDPNDWWNALVKTVRQVCRDPETAASVAAISLSTQGGTLVPVDENYGSVRPAFVWNDIRCKEECQVFDWELGADTIYQKTGWALEPSQNLMQIRWMKDHEPDLFDKTAYFLSVPDYMSYRLTGIAAIDPSNMGINQLGDIRSGAYDAELLAFAGIRAAQLPKIQPSGTSIGCLTAEAAAALGLSEQVVLVAGAHDQYAVALGAGACEKDDILIGTGTCWVVTRISDQPDFASGLSQSVAAAPGMWGSLCALSSGGVCLDWLRKSILSDGAGQSPSYEQINEEVACREAAKDGLFFYPFTGYARDGAFFKKGTFAGMDLSHDKYHLARAVMEGVAYQILWMLEGFHAAPKTLRLTGGATKSRLWCQMVADMSGLPVTIPETADLGCVGAAILAGVGCGIYEDARQGYARMAIPEETILPDPGRTAMYQKQEKLYRQLAGQLHPIAHLFQ